MSFKQDRLGDWIKTTPGADLDYAFDLTDWLNAGDEISSAVWTLDAGINIGAQSETATQAKIWVSGFVVGVVYSVSCKITTVAGRIDTKYFRFVCKAENS